MHKNALLTTIVIALSACGSPSKRPAPQTAPANQATPVQTAAPAAPADRCTAVADHFEPWRSNEYWRDEVSPREQLISDCRANHWSDALIDCLLAANAPLELDGCIGVDDGAE